MPPPMDGDFPEAGRTAPLTRSGSLADYRGVRAASESRFPYAHGPPAHRASGAQTLYCPNCRDGFTGVTGRCVRCDEGLVDSYFQMPCPECGAENRINRQGCWKCGTDLAAFAPVKGNRGEQGAAPSAKATVLIPSATCEDGQVPLPTIDLPPVPVFPAGARSVRKPSRRCRVTRTTQSSGFGVSRQMGLSDWDKLEIGLDVAGLVLSIIMELADND